MIKTYCDICEKEITDGEGFIRIQKRFLLKSYDFKTESISHDAICEDCFNKIYKFVKNLKNNEMR